MLKPNFEEADGLGMSCKQSQVKLKLNSSIVDRFGVYIKLMLLVKNALFFLYISE